MPITIKQNTLKYKDTETGQYHGMDAVSDYTTSESVALIQQTGHNVLESIPDDYTALSDNVAELDESAVRVTVQSFEEGPKSVARANIGAASDSDLSELSETVSDQGGYISDLTAAVGTVPTGETVEGQITDLESALKNELLQLLQHVVYTDQNGLTYYNAFRDALDSSTPTPTLSSISAIFNQGSTVIYDTDSLNSLKAYLTVTATYSDSSTETVAPADYTLSGTLTVGTSTVTVSYGGKTTTFNVTVSNPTYTPVPIYSNYTATGQRFSTGDISIDFAAGDYVEAVIDASSEDVVSGTNLIGVAKDGSDGYLEYSTGEAVLVYKRDQSGTMKVLFRIRDTANNVAIDKWVLPSDFSNLVIKIDKDGVYLDGTAVSDVSSSTLAFLTEQSKIAIGARASKLSYATYSSVTVYRLQQRE